MPATPDGRAIHEAVARAAGLRHRASRRHHAWRSAPLFAAGFLALAVAGRLSGWSPLLALAGGVALALLLGGYALLPRPAKPVSDAEATALDERAVLGGELRSAHWFADHAEEGPWVGHHLSRAVTRIRETAWPQLYEAQPATRAYATTAVLAIAAVIVAVVGPTTRAAMAPGVQDERAGGGTLDRPLTTMEIERELAALLATLEPGRGQAGRVATADDVRKLLDRIKESQRKTDGKKGADIDESLRDRLDKAAKSESLDADMRSALDDLKSALQASKDKDQNAKTNDGPKEATGKTDQAPGANAQSGKSDGGKPDPSAQMSSDSQPGSGFGVVAMADNPSGDPGKPGLGLGGGEKGAPNAGIMADLGAALRQETLETGAGESAGDPATDLRHKTDRGTASVAFSRGAAAAAVRGRANAVPIVPEARRPAARAYFQRKR